MGRSPKEIVEDAIRLQDRLLDLAVDEDLGIAHFDREKSIQIMDEYTALKLEYRKAVAHARKVGIDLRGLPQPFGYVHELDNTN
jgi:hypothetical protein